MRRLWMLTTLIITVVTLFSSSLFAAVTSNRSVVTVLSIKGAIGPAADDYIRRGIEKSEKMQAKAIVLSIDTPGGLSTSMRGIIKAILASSTPVISYVSPSGARAASAGTYILYASHIAAMAPGTNLGAATPVNMVSPKSSGDKSDQEKNAKAAKSASELKALNDAKAYIRSLAQLRNRNVEWAVKAVDKGESLSATEALKLNVINLIAPSISSLLQSVNGQKIQINGKEMVLQLVNPELVSIAPDWRSKMLHIITDPSIAYILLMLGVYGLFFEFMNPGYVMPGVVGAIALLLALYAFQLLPINYTGFILIILGIIFMISEAFVPSFGALGFGGVISFILGSFLLLETQSPGYTLPWQLIIGVAVTTVIFMIGLIQLFWRSRKRPIVSGTEGMIGEVGEVEKDASSCWVKVHGERWHVRSDAPLVNEEKVKVVHVDGLTVIVEPVSQDK